MLSNYRVETLEFNLTRFALQVLVFHCYPHVTFAHVLRARKTQAAFGRHTFKTSSPCYLRIDHDHSHGNVSGTGAYSPNAVNRDDAQWLSDLNRGQAYAGI